MVGRVVVAVPESAAGTRADRFVADAAGLSRSYVQRLITEGRLTSGGAAIKANAGPPRRRRAGARRPRGPTPTSSKPRPSRWTVVYEDADLLIIDKPAGLVVHPAPGHASGTLVNALLAQTAASAASPASPDRASSIGSTVTRAG